jgi:hypothetical protein
MISLAAEPGKHLELFEGALAREVRLPSRDRV